MVSEKKNLFDLNKQIYRYGQTKGLTFAVERAVDRMLELYEDLSSGEKRESRGTMREGLVDLRKIYISRQKPDDFSKYEEKAKRLRINLRK